jgi:hypothetical protein
MTTGLFYLDKELLLWFDDIRVGTTFSNTNVHVGKNL